MKELEKDMAILRNGMKEVGRELEFFRTQPPTNGDRYSSDMITSIVKVCLSLLSKNLQVLTGDERVSERSLGATSRTGRPIC